MQDALAEIKRCSIAHDSLDPPVQDSCILYIVFMDDLQARNVQLVSTKW